MGLNIKNREVERLAAEAARPSGESKTESIRQALEERVARLRLRVVKRDREASLLRYLEHEVWRVILDSSAIVGIVLREPGFEGIVRKLSTAGSLGVGAPTLAEAGIVLSARLRTDARALLQGLLLEWEAETIAFGAEHWREAVSVVARFGRGRHRAQLNFGDCMACAVATLAEEPLLCTGGDFAKTDLALA